MLFVARVHPEAKRKLTNIFCSKTANNTVRQVGDSIEVNVNHETD